MGRASIGVALLAVVAACGGRAPTGGADHPSVADAGDRHIVGSPPELDAGTCEIYGGTCIPEAGQGDEGETCETCETELTGTIPCGAGMICCDCAQP